MTHDVYFCQFWTRRRVLLIRMRRWVGRYGVVLYCILYFLICCLVPKVMEKLCKYIYCEDLTDRVRTRAILCHIYHHAIHWFESRDLMLMSHLQDTVHHSYPSTQILYSLKQDDGPARAVRLQARADQGRAQRAARHPAGSIWNWHYRYSRSRYDSVHGVRKCGIPALWGTF